MNSVKQTAGNAIGKGKAGPGRTKGVPNKVTAVAKDAIAQAAAELGGAQRLVTWVRQDKKNEHAFWTVIYPKLIPVQIGGDPNNPLTVVTSVRLLGPDDV